MSIEYAKQLYKQCSEAYARCVEQYNTVYCFNDMEIRCPDDFDDEFNAPAVLLFEELCHNHKKMDGHYDDFRRNLLKLIHEKKDFDKIDLCKLPTRQQLKAYRVYFEVFFWKKSNDVKPPFKQQITINGMTFSRCSQQTMLRNFDNYQLLHKSKLGVPRSTLDEQRALCFPKLTAIDKRNIYPMVVTVRSANTYAAVDLALCNFELVENVVNIVQVMGSQSVQYGGKPPAKNTMTTTGLYMAINQKDPNDSALLKADARVYELPKQKLSFTNNTSRMDLFREILRALCNKSAISQRICSVVNELSLAYSTDNSGLRQLSYWRCLELATRRSGDSRKEKEIIRIFQNYYPNHKFWEQMGDMVLKLRNTYVHQGKLMDAGGFSSDYYLNWSQQYAEKALYLLLYLYKNKSTWKTVEDVDKFFDYYAESDHSLKLAQQLLRSRQRHV